MINTRKRVMPLLLYKLNMKGINQKRRKGNQTWQNIKRNMVTITLKQKTEKARNSNLKIKLKKRASFE